MEQSLNLAVFAARAMSKDQRFHSLDFDATPYGDSTSIISDMSGERQEAAYKIMRAFESYDETKILQMIRTISPIIVKAAENQTPFDQLSIACTSSPNSLINLYCLYRVSQILLNKETDHSSELEKHLLEMMYFQQGDKSYISKMYKLPQHIRSLGVNGENRTILTAFDGSPLMYSFFEGILQNTGVSLNEIETIKLNKSDFNDVLSQVMICRETLKEYKETDDKDDAAKQNTKELDSRDSTYKDHTLVLIGVTLKLFACLLKKKDEQIKELKKRKPETITVVKEDVTTKKKLDQKQELLNQSQIKIDKLTLKVSELKQELELANDYIETMNKGSDFVEKQLEADLNASPIITSEEKQLLVGGHLRWQKKFSQKYPHIRIIDADQDGRIDEKIIKNAHKILLNTNNMSHSLFYRVMPIVRRLKIPVQYVW